MKKILTSPKLYLFLAGCVFGLLIIALRNQDWTEAFILPGFLAIGISVFLGVIMESIFGSYYLKDNLEAWTWISFDMCLVIIYGFIFLYIYRLATFIVKKYKA